jgi:hypothetical protein
VSGTAPISKSQIQSPITGTATQARFELGHVGQNVQLGKFSHAALSLVIMVSLCALSATTAVGLVVVDPNAPGVLEPARTAVDGEERRIPHTDQVVEGNLENVVGGLVRRSARGSQSLLGQTIRRVSSPNDDPRPRLRQAGISESLHLPGKLFGGSTRTTERFSTTPMTPAKATGRTKLTHMAGRLSRESR